jgi:hypothetical protein
MQTTDHDAKGKAAYQAAFEECLKSMPPAGHGHGFNNIALPRAVGWAKRAGIPAEEAIGRISETQTTAARDPESEITRAVERIYAEEQSTGRHKRPNWPEGDAAKIMSVLAQECLTVEQLSQRSPVGELAARSWKEFVTMLFEGEPLVTVGQKREHNGNTSIPGRTMWLPQLLRADMPDEFIVPSPAIRRLARKKDGSLSEHCAANYGPRHFLVVEFDSTSKDDAASVLWHLSKFAPLVMVVDSGNKSLHGWYHCEGVLDADVLLFFKYAVSLGADPKMWDIWQFARMPNGTRFGSGAKQQVVYWNPDAIDGRWNLSDLPGNQYAVRSIMDFPTDLHEADANLIGNRFLYRGKGMMVIGPTGVGKSTLVVQAAIMWSLGRSFLGFAVPKPIRSLLVQAENDPEDLFEMVNGIREKADLSGDDSALVAKRVYSMTVTAYGDEWLANAASAVEKYHPDLLIIDPLFAFLPGKLVDQGQVSAFLRGKLQPFLEQHHLGCILVHHVNKPASSKRDRPEWHGSDFAYAGSGSSEIANWAKASMILRTTPGSRNVFELVIGKRYEKAGILDAEGAVTDTVHVCHSPDPSVVYWDIADPALVQTVETQRLKDLAIAFLKKRRNQSALIKAVADEMGLSKRTVDRMFEGNECLETPAFDGVEAMVLVRDAGKIYLKDTASALNGAAEEPDFNRDTDYESHKIPITTN